MKFVAGFLFDLDRKNVALIRKQKPEWMVGKLNGIGGKVENEEGDTQMGTLKAMQREFIEETGVAVIEWRLFCEYRHRQNIIYFYEGVGDLSKLRSVEAEEVVVVAVATIPDLKTMRNLKWLIPMALDDSPVTAIVRDQSGFTL